MVKEAKQELQLKSDETGLSSQSSEGPGCRQAILKRARPIISKDRGQQFYLSRMHEALYHSDETDPVSVVYRKHLFQNYLVYNHFKNSVPQFSKSSTQESPVRPMVVFDLDDTLVRLVQPSEGFDFSVQISKGHRRSQLYLRVRPHVEQVLAKLSLNYDLAIYTAGKQHYASQIVSRLDPKGTLFKSVLTRKDCLLEGGVFVKDISKVCADLTRVVLVDNNLASYIKTPENGIPIIPYQNEDDELLKLSEFLESIRGAADLRKEVMDHFRPTWLYSGEWVQELKSFMALKKQKQVL